LTLAQTYSYRVNDPIFAQWFSNTVIAVQNVGRTIAHFDPPGSAPETVHIFVLHGCGAATSPVTAVGLDSNV